METSETLTELAPALAKAQALIQGAQKSKINPAFRSHYADLADIWEACRGPLTTHGFSIVQVPTTDGAALTVTTRLLHASGEWIEDAWTMVAKDASPQALMSCLTYARRGALASFVGVAPEDDDGEAAQGRGTHVNGNTGEIHNAAKPPAKAPIAAPAPTPNGTVTVTLVGPDWFRVTDVETKTGTKNDRPWTKYTVAFDDGRKGQTFETKIGALAARAYESGEAVTRTLVENSNPKFLPDLTALALKAGDSTTPAPEADDPFGRMDDAHV